MKFDYAIFDLDGTLVDSVEDLANAVNYGLQQMHLPIHPVEKYYHFVGNGVPKLCQSALPNNATPEQLEQLLTIFNTYYMTHCLECTRPYNGIVDVLKQMQCSGIGLAVASNKTTDFSKKIVTHLFGENLFSQILGGNESRPKKPSPEIIYEIIEKSGIDSSQVVMIGDSDVDIITAINAGSPAIGCVWGFRCREEIENSGADFLAETPADLLEIIL